MARVADAGIMCEVCPTSNLLLGVVDDLAEHPLPRMMEAGVQVCINTDDPGWFDTDILTELAIASDDLGIRPDQHLAMQRDAVDASSATADVRRRIIGELDGFERAPG